MINIPIILNRKYMILCKTHFPFYTFYTFYITIE